MTSSEYLREIAYNIAEESSKLLKKNIFIENTASIVSRNSAGDYSHKIDVLIEEYIIKQLENSGLKLLIVSEETGLYRTCSEYEYIVLIDPLDGSFNYVSKIPLVAVSIVFYSIDKPYIDSAIAGAISNVFFNEIYSFNSNEVYINEYKVNNIEKKIRGIVSIYTDNPDTIIKVRDFIENDLKIDAKIRTLGSSAIESIYAALNRIDLFIHNTGKLRNFDIAGGIAIANRLKTPYSSLNGGEIKYRVDDIVKIDSVIIGLYASEIVNKFK